MCPRGGPADGDHAARGHSQGARGSVCAERAGVWQTAIPDVRTNILILVASATTEATESFLGTGKFHPDLRYGKLLD